MNENEKEGALNEKGINKPGASLKDRPVRIICREITKEDAGMTVREYLNTKMRFSSHQISSLKFRADGIVVNGLTRRVTTVLSTGDILQIGLKDAGNGYLVPGDFTRGPGVLYEDEDMLIVNKEQGMVCHPSPGHYSDTLANQVAFYAREKKEDWTIRLIGRLDADTSGILVFAKNSETAALLTKQRAEGNMEKTYLAICEGLFQEDMGLVDVPISRDEARMGKMKAAAGGKEARTYFRVISRGKRSTLVKVKIREGRTHQIRVHMSYIGHPLVGDPFYGSGREGEDHTMLHARWMKLTHPFTQKELLIEAPLPDRIKAYIDEEL